MNQVKTWPAPAKLNLFLHITSKRDDGYHNLQTVFVFLDKADEIQFIPREDAQVIRHYNISDVDEASDLILRAVKLLLPYRQAQGLPSGLDIQLNKILPMGGGLGGGSSDAATTLVALNQIWQLGLTKEKLAELGLSLGADVPVFVNGNAVWAEGVGERFSPIEIEECDYIVLRPPVHISTAELFSHPELNRNQAPISVQDFMDGQGINVFESIACQVYPEVKEALDWLGQFGPARMTGTGSCIFSQISSAKVIQEVLQSCPKKYEAFIAKGRKISPLYEC